MFLVYGGHPKYLSDYLSVRYLKAIDPQINNCYLCGKPLDLKITPDHIIPDHFFDRNDPFRPKLDVHNSCNNSKSKDDQWFIKQIQLRSVFNPRAEKEFSTLMEKAIDERPDAYIIGKKLTNYKFVKGIFDKVNWGLELKHGEQSFIQLQISKKNAIRFQEYVETMCRGLFIRNVPSSNPSATKLILKQYADLELRGKDISFMNTIKALIDNSRNSNFMQRWSDRVLYFGSRVVESPDRGFLFVQFYSQFGIFAVFN